jgi:hypothetical protein
VYLQELKASLVKGWRETFDGSYIALGPVETQTDFQNLWIDIEFPNKSEQYPSVWVDFAPVGDVENVGIGHKEYVLDDTVDPAVGRRVFRWKFQGSAQFTILALSSLERDRLYDELVRNIAFGSQSPQTSVYRSYIENNPLIATDFDWDQITTSGTSQSIGTPWGTDELIYETTLSVEVLGEFVSDESADALVPLADVLLEPYAPTEPEPSWVP